jgi:hypothetical protein
MSRAVELVQAPERFLVKVEINVDATGINQLYNLTTIWPKRLYLGVSGSFPACDSCAVAFPCTSES